MVLVDPRNPLNIGAAARAMSNFGFFDLRVVNPYQVAFREAKSAVKAGAVLESAKEYTTLAEALGDCRLVVGTTGDDHRQLRLPLLPLEQAAPRLRKALAAAPVALVFGSEKFGLGNDEFSHCQWLLRIPSRPEHRSMNLGQAVAISLYELIRDPKPPKPSIALPKLATVEQKERFLERLLDALQKSGYLNPKTAASSQRKLRHMINRLDLSAHDAEAWQGMLRQILWKLSQSPD